MTSPAATLMAASSFAVERRINPFKPELRSANGGGPEHIVGYASVFNKLSRKLAGGFVERVNPSAFQRSKDVGFDGVVCRFDHDPQFLLGTIAGRTVQIDFDQDGLKYDVIPPNGMAYVLELCQRGDVTSSSFAFRNVEGGDDWELSDFGMPLRTLLSLDLIDVAPVVQPAYPDATASARSFFAGAIESLAHKFDADPVEIRSLFQNNQTVKLFKNTQMRNADPVEPPTVPDITEEAVMAEGQNAAFYEELRKNYDKASRDKMAKAGTAMPDGSFPIADEDDLHNAVKLAGHADNPSAAKAHIKKRAKALGKTDAIPDDWDGDEKKSEETEGEERAVDDLPAKVQDKIKGKKAKKDSTKDEDGDGVESSGNGTEDEGRSEDDEEDEEESSEERAAKANWGDMETCGDCGAKNQFGKHCTECGKPMNPDSTMSKFCPNCGQKAPKADAKRSEHECEVEVREDETAAQETTEEVTNGHTVDKGEAQLAKIGMERRQMMMALLEKRIDPYLGIHDGE